MRIDNENGRKTLTMCDPCCDNCPQAYIEGDMVIITDDNDVETSGVRQIKLTKEQFSMLIEGGKNII